MKKNKRDLVFSLFSLALIVFLMSTEMICATAIGAGAPAQGEIGIAMLPVGLFTGIAASALQRKNKDK